MQVHPEKTPPDLVNFCIQPFVTQVTSTSVCADDHAPATLAALSSTARSKGFRVERYVRPPVYVGFRLAVPVGVSCLLLCPDLNVQTEMRFEVSVCGGRGTVDQQVYHGTVHGSTDSRDTVLALLNPGMWDRSMGAQCVSSTQVLGSYAGATLQTGQVQECWMKYSPVLAQCHQVCVNIIRWTGVKPVSLKWVELWGGLATSCSKSEQVTYQRGRCMLTDKGPAGNELSLPHFFASDPENPAQPESLNDHNVTGVKSNNVRGSVVAGTGSDVVVSGESVDKSVASSSSKARDVPIQLLDEITFEVMELPMVLPSGRCVDASTLDKLAAADAACGRPPTDPFTGNLHTVALIKNLRHASSQPLLIH